MQVSIFLAFLVRISFCICGSNCMHLASGMRNTSQPPSKQ
ncbi:unnamed protein product [Lathyrus oleraceus]